MRLFLLPLPLLATLLGCGPDPGLASTNEFKGTIHQNGGSYSLQVTDAFFVRIEPPSGPGGIAIFLSDRPGACAALQANPLADLRSSSSLLLSLANLVNDSTSRPIVTGDYPVSTSSGRTGTVSSGVFRSKDASCATRARADARSGSVTLTTAPAGSSGGRAIGTFDLGMVGLPGAPADAITGRFDVGECPFDPWAGGSVACD